MIYYRQCRLKRGDAVTTTWIPEKFAKKGKYLKLKEDDDWIDGWLVMQVADTRQPEEYVAARSRDYLRQRDFSDI